MDKTNRRSICYMSLADAFLTRLRRDAENRTKQRMTKGVSVEVLPVTVDKLDFIYDYLMKLHVNKKGTFSKKKSFKRQTIYECERSSVCKGNSSGDPTRTRANGCSAYVSFMFEEGATITACVTRSRLTHCGHNPSNREEARVNRIDLALKCHIEMHIQRGMKTYDIMNEIGKWNKLQGNTDHRNRRYFPSHKDIQQLALSVKKPDNNSDNPDFKLKGARKFDVLKRDNIAHLLRTEYRESCVYYQSQTTSDANPRPLILVMQNNDQRKMLSAHGKQIVFIEKNCEGLCQYGYAIYVMVVRDGCGNGFPLSYIITSNDDSIAFMQALQKLKVRCQLNPRVFFIERDLKKFIEAFRATFPESLCLMSWFQVMQDVHKWLQNSLISNKEHADLRKYLLHLMQELKKCSKEEDLLATWEMQQNIEYEDFASVVQVEFLSCAPMWCDFGRIFISDGSLTGCKTESFFLKIKKLWLKGLHTRKSLEDVLKLVHNIIEQCNFVDGMMNMSVLLEDTASDQAAILLQQGWSQLITWQGQWIAHVPCHEILETTYEVNIITMECDCPSQTYMGPCLHLRLITAIVCTRDGMSPQEERHRCALEAFENCSFIKDKEESYATFHNDIMCVTNLEDGSCTCIASAFDVECVGKMLLKIAEGKEQNILYSVPPVNTEIFCDTSCVTENTKSENKRYGLKQTTSQPKFTISVLTEIDKSSVSKDISFDISKSIVIQTHSKMEKDILNNIPISSKNCSSSRNNELIELNDNNFEPSVHKSNSQAIIEKLYKWSNSNRFKDSKELCDALHTAYSIILKFQNEDLEVHHDQQGQIRNDFTNKNLRTTLRSVKRNLNIHEDLPVEDTFTSAVPSLKRSRSGRTIKAKEKSDFIT